MRRASLEEAAPVYSRFIAAGDSVLKAASALRLLVPVGSLAAASCARSPAPGPALFSSRAAPSVQALPDQGFRVEWVSNTFPKRVKAGSHTLVSVTLKNIGTAVWLDRASTGNQPPQAGAVRISYRWLPSGRRPSAYAEPHVDLAGPLAPGRSATLGLSVAAPSAPGAYRLQFDLVQEFVAWFEGMDAPRLVVPVRVF
jgi:hypothetical protein